MPNLNYTVPDFTPFTTIRSADVNSRFSDIQTLLNDTKLDDTNVQDGGITASTKLVAASVTGALLDPAIVDDSTIEISSNTLQVKDGGITATKIAVVDAPVPGEVKMFHTFNGILSVPRGWMILNGDLVDQTNYDALHGAGSYSTDGVGSSALVNLNLPDMTGNAYATGVAATTADGSIAIPTKGANTINLQHSHTVDSHNHQWHEDGSNINESYDSGGNLLALNSSLTSTANSGGIAFGDASAANVLDSVGGSPTISGGNLDDDFFTSNATPGTDNQLSATQDNQPLSVEFIYIMKVI